VAQSTARSSRSSSPSSAARARVAAAKPRKTAKVTTTKTHAQVAKPVVVVPEEVRTPASEAPASQPPGARRESGIVPRMSPRGYVPLVDIPKPPPPPRDFTLNVGDKAVHPSHGLAEVTAIEHREIGSMKGEFYILRIIDNGMRVMVPRASSAAAGIRPVMSSKEADRVLETMKAREVAVDLQPWSRRFRAYTEMIKCGSPQEVAKVLRDMYRLKFDKDLSFGERRLLDQAKSLLMKELAAAKGVPEPVLQAQVDDMFRA
jgi:CarD family transcriptional regulator